MRIAVVIALLASAACDGAFTPEGSHHHYVISAIGIPSVPNQADQLGLDLSGDGRVDNAIGRAFVMLENSGLSISIATDLGIRTGSVINLIDLQTRDFQTATSAGLQVLAGASPIPDPCPNLPCAGACGIGELCDSDLRVCFPEGKRACGLHLDGNGQFTTTSVALTNDPVLGATSAGAFAGAGDHLTVQISIDRALVAQRTPAITIPLLRTQVRITKATEMSIEGGVIAGAVPQEGLEALTDSIKSVVRRNLTTCERVATPPSCSCLDPTAAAMAAGFDTIIPDCNVTDQEFEAHPALMVLRQPDLAIDGFAASSFGVGFVAVHAEF